MVSLSIRISATVMVGALWFAFIVLYLAFYAGNLDFWQKAAVFLASMAIACAITAVFWIRWMIQEPQRQSETFKHAYVLTGRDPSVRSGMRRKASRAPPGASLNPVTTSSRINGVRCPGRLPSLR
jgi:hypothetical protein